MEFQLIVKGGKSIQGGKLISDYITTLNGIYRVLFIPDSGMTTVTECRAAYFAKVDVVVDHTGSKRYTIHEEFKEHQKIVSTKDLTVVDWRNLIKQFQSYIFEKLDIVV